MMMGATLVGGHQLGMMKWGIEPLEKNSVLPLVSVIFIVVPKWRLYSCLVQDVGQARRWPWVRGNLHALLGGENRKTALHAPTKELQHVKCGVSGWGKPCGFILLLFSCGHNCIVLEQKNSTEWQLLAWVILLMKFCVQFLATFLKYTAISAARVVAIHTTQFPLL